MLRSLRPAGAIGLLAALAAGTADAAPIVLPAQGAGPGSAVLELDAERLITMTRIPFRLMVRDGAGRPVTGARVECDLTMPAMAMPKNRPKVSAREDHYGGELIFTCAQGAWRISCEVEREGQPPQTLIFDIDRVQMR